MRVALLVSAALALGLVAGCGGDGDGGGNSDRSRTVERTEVQVIENPGQRTGFNPAGIYERYSDGVVTVTSLFEDGGSSSLLDGEGAAGQGTGFVLDGDGYIATNAHVITDGRGENIKRARTVYVQFPDGNQVEAKIVGFDPNSDVGLIRVEEGGIKLVPLKLGRSSTVRVGEFVVAIGSPFGEEQSLSVGVVSATNRTIEALTEFQIGDAIQTDAAINRGNSGGPLMNAQGEVIGINSQIRSASGGSEGVGFAVPVDTVKRSIAQLRSDGKVRYGYIGVSSQPLYPQLAERLDLPVDEGSLVAEVVKDGPAAEAGLKGGGKEIRFQATLVHPGGDLITKVNGAKVTRERDLSELISRYSPGDTVTLEVYRGNDRRTVKIELDERPGNLPK
jgi:S1-C subfamily serine protease